MRTIKEIINEKSRDYDKVHQNQTPLMCYQDGFVKGASEALEEVRERLKSFAYTNDLDVKDTELNNLINELKS